MSIRQENIEGGLALQLPGSLTIDHARDLRTGLASAFAQGLPMVVDLSQVADIDAAGLQLLAALCRDSRTARQGLRLVSPSAAVIEAATLCGLGPVLGLAGGAP